MITIRTFRNSDTPIILRLWNQYRAEAGLYPPMTTATVEVVVLNRPYFDPQQLLIASIDGRDCGFLHWLPLPDSPQKAVVANIAVTRREQQDELAAELLVQACQKAQTQGVATMLLGQAPEYWTGYAGVGRYGMGGGIPETDHLAVRWARSANFQSHRSLEAYKLELASYRPVFDRELLAMRRTSKVERKRDITDVPFRVAAAMSHMELHRFVAVSQQGKQLAQAEILLGDPEMMIVSGKAALLSGWHGFAQRPSENQAALKFVISAAIGDLVAERIESLQATIEAGDSEPAAMLTSVGFSLEQRGTIYCRSL